MRIILLGSPPASPRAWLNRESLAPLALALAGIVGVAALLLAANAFPGAAPWL
jgi:hypothetical protein